MHSEDFNEIVLDQIETCKETLIKKAGEYARGDVDRLHNFRQAANLSGDSMRKVLGGMMMKHTVSIYDMLNGDDTHSMDLWDEKITDHINYLLLLRAVVIEGKREQSEEPDFKLRREVEALKLLINAEEQQRAEARQTNDLPANLVDNPKDDMTARWTGIPNDSDSRSLSEIEAETKLNVIVSDDDPVDPPKPYTGVNTTVPGKINDPYISETPAQRARRIRAEQEAALTDTKEQPIIDDKTQVLEQVKETQ